MTVDTLYLMAIHMVMVNPVLTAYPYIGDAFHTRVLLCVCAPDEGGVYCGRWWPTLSWAFENGRVQGALAEPAGKPGTNTPPPLNDYVWGPIYPWPTYWAQPTIYWQIGFERGSDSDANYNRDYWFDLLGSPWYTPVGGDQWGEDYRTYSVMGQHRLRVYVVWGAVGWSSNDWEHATRIFVRNRSVYVPPMPPLSNDAQRRSYSEWLSSYYDEPYEWGGEWVGGKETPGTARAGGPATYDGYGIDCSGLVCNAAYRAAYNWNAGWRTDTTGLASSYYTSATATPTAGDLLVKPTHHVISIVGQSGDSINIIHAKGGSSGDPQPKNKVAYETGKSRQYYLDRDYQGRTMLQHWGRVI